MEYALEMPAGQFFAMLETARVLRNKERVLDCYVARSAQTSAEGFEAILGYFTGLETPKEIPAEYRDDLPSNVTPILSKEQAKDAVRAALAGTRMINYPLIKVPDGG